MYRRVLIGLAGVAVAVVAAAGPASAHVTVNPGTADKGGFAKLAFRVPTESATASTVEVAVQLPDPQTAPLAFASVQPHAGWSYKVEKAHLAKPVTTDDGEVTDVVRTITWTANTPADGIKPGEFDEFAISVGPLPSGVDALTFKVVQTYSDGEVARWIDEGESAEHPAPVLTLTSSGAAATPTTAPARSAGATAAVDTSDVDRAKTLGVVGIVVGVLGLLVATAALVTSRRRTT
jgi:uncharacterized protein YcnI